MSMSRSRTDETHVRDAQLWDREVRQQELHVLFRALHYKSLLALAVIAAAVLVGARYNGVRSVIT